MATGAMRVHVYRASTAPRPSALRLLDDTELQRLSQLRREPDRDRYVATHALARLAVAEHGGVDPASVQFSRVCPTCGGDHGKPRVRFAEGVVPRHGVIDPASLPLVTDGSSHTPPRGPLTAAPWVSLSHSGGVVLVALTRAGDVGVDVEDVASASFEEFAGVALSPEETAELATVPPAGRGEAQAVWWTRKEAVLKATGRGLLADPRRVVVTPPWQPPALRRWGDPPAPPGPVALHDLDVGAGHAASVAVITTYPTTVELHDGDAVLERLALP